MGTGSSKVSSDSAAEARLSGWKTGFRTTSIPAPFSSLNSFEKLAKSSDFKDWITRNLDSDYLVTSILLESSTTEALEDNIEFFRTLSPAVQDEIMKHINDFELATMAGIDLHLSDTLHFCEKELLMRMNAVSSPYFRSFQMRLIALKGIEDCLIGEKKVAQEERKTRDYVPAALNSSTYPQLVFVLGLMKCGVNFVGMFPTFIDLLVDVETRNLLIAPLENLCSTICSLSNLQLFECWSPLRRAPLKKVPLNIASVTASSGHGPGSAIDGKPATYWLCTRSRATWTVDLDKSSTSTSSGPINVVAIQIGWRPQQPTTVPHHSAPKKLSIYIKKAKDKTESPSPEFVRVLSIDPEQEYGKQNSWTQTYYINCSDITAIQVSVSKQAASNPTSSVKMYSFEVLTEDNESSSLQTLPMLKLVQSSLMPLLKYDFLEKIVFDTVLSMVRISGSLSVAISLIHFIHEKQLDTRLKSIASDSVFQLLGSMHFEETLLKEEADTISAAEKCSVDVSFDETAKSAAVEITQGGQVVTLNTSQTGYQYCMLSAVMDSGIWEWDLSMVALKDATSYFGVGKRPLEEGEIISPDAWVVRCVDGVVRQGVNVLRPPVGMISPSDVCNFTFDVEAETVSLAINGDDPQLIFEHVPKGVSPLVFLQEMGKSIRLLGVRHRPQEVKSPTGETAGAVANSSSSSSSSALGDPIKIDDIQNKPTAVTTLLLKKMAKLSKSKIAQLVTQLVESKRKQSMLFEHPYSIEVSAETLHQLVRLLQDVISTANLPVSTAHVMPQAETEQQVLSILQIIDSQLYCLSYSEVDPISLGIPCVRAAVVEEDGLESDLDESVHTVQLLSTLLNTLRQSSTCSEEVRSCAAKAFARGSSLFLPDAADKLELVLSILTRALRSGHLDNPTILLLEMMLQRLSRHVEVLQVIQLYKKSPDARKLVIDLLKRLLIILQNNAVQPFLVHSDMWKSSEGENIQSLLPIPGQSTFCRIIITFLSRFQEQLIHDVSIHRAAKESFAGKNGSSDCDVSLLLSYCEMLSECSLVVSRSASHYSSFIRSSDFRMKNNTGSDVIELPHSLIERQLRDTLLCHLLLPFLHGLACISSSRVLELVAGILPIAVKLLETFTKATHASDACKVAAAIVNSTIRRPIPRPAVSLGAYGWKVVKACFEDGEGSFTVGDNGTLYTSVHSSNTCGIVNIGFDRTMKAAWEFCLESDSINDECSVFGAAKMPVVSRCYSSSPDLWMRRAYNGYMYAQGATRGAAMEKIHPDDVIRIEFDGKAGTLSFSLNGSEPVIGFTDITDTIYPACGSYRGAVQIRLLKVEVFGAASAESDSSLDSNSNDRSPSAINWALDDSLQNSVEPSVLCPPKVDGKALDGTKAWLTARGDRGASEGVHDWSFEMLLKSHTAYAVGVVVDGEPHPHDILGGPCLSSADPRHSKNAPNRRSQRGTGASSSGVLSSRPGAPTSALFVSNWPQGRDLSTSPVPYPTYAHSRRRGRIRGESGDRDRDREETRARASVQNGFASVSTFAFQRLLRAAAPEFIPASPQPRAPESDLNVDLDAILAGFLSPNDSEGADNGYQQRILPTSFLSSDEIPFPQDTPQSTESLLDMGAPKSSDVAIASLFVDSVAQMEQASQAVRDVEEADAIAAATAVAVAVAVAASSSTPALESTTGSTSAALSGKMESVKEAGKLPAQSNYSEGMLAMAWHSDGSLWVNGQKAAEGFGSKFLPLDRMASITIRIDRTERTVTYYVNGVYVGVAFGPQGSEAAVFSPLPALTPSSSSSGAGPAYGRCIVYPAGSISLPAAKESSTAPLLSIRLRSTGFNGSTVLPLLLTLQKTCASVVGRLASILLTGPSVDPEEVALNPWLRSPLLIGGIDANMPSLFAGEMREGSNIDGKSMPENNGDRCDDKSIKSFRDEGTRALQLSEGDKYFDLSAVLSDPDPDEKKRNSSDVSEDTDLEHIAVIAEGDGEGEEPTEKEMNVFKGESKLSWESAWEAMSSNNSVNVLNGADNMKFSTIYKTAYTKSDSILESNPLPLDSEEYTKLQKKNSMKPFACNGLEVSLSTLRSRKLFESLSMGNAGLNEETSVFVHWLENILPEPASLRIVLERSGSYNFPSCELPFLACLLKHSGLVEEALDVLTAAKECSSMREGTIGSSTGVTDMTEISATLPAPSEDMVSLWRRVKQLRTYLRQQRQRIKALTSAASVPVSVPPSPAGPYPSTSPVSTPVIESEKGAGSMSPASLSVEVSDVSKEVKEVVGKGDASDASERVADAASRAEDGREGHVAAAAPLTPRADESAVKIGFDVPVTRIADTTVPASALKVAAVSSEKVGATLEEVKVTPSEAPKEIPSFDELCDLVRSKALFLLRVNPASNGSETDFHGIKSKTLLFNLMSVYKKEEREDLKDPPPLRNQVSLTGQERWQKVIEFLRVHSKVKKENSIDSEGLIGTKLRDELYVPKFGFSENSRVEEESPEWGGNEKDGLGDDRGNSRVREDERSRGDGERTWEESEISPLQAALQSCALFCTAEGISVSPVRLDAIMSRRALRASLRVYAMQAISTVMTMESVVSDPFSMEELLLYVRSALTTSVKKGSSTSHYLANLEGCDAESLGEVQASFLELFSSLSSILSQYIEAWEQSSLTGLNDYFISKIDSASPLAASAVSRARSDIERFISSPSSSSSNSPGPAAVSTPSGPTMRSPPSSSLIGETSKNNEKLHGTDGMSHLLMSSLHPSNTSLTPETAHVLLGPIKMILALWGLHYSSRDHRFLMQAGFLPAVHKLISLVSYERASNAHAISSALLLRFKKKYSTHFYGVVDKWSLWSAPYVEKGLLSGNLSCKSVILHLVQTPDSVLTRAEKTLLGLDKDFLTLCSELSVAEVSLLFLKVGILISNKEEEEKKKMDIKANEDAAIALIVEEEMTRKLSVCGVFDPLLIGTDLKLEHRNTQAMRRGDATNTTETPVCAFSTIEYDLTQGPSVTGNYFEVTILILGEKDIGVGLADKSVFTVNANMPGWINGSYGYHGDDGRKFGDNATPGDWPLFETGDVIGCGIIMDRKIIFYTRNGELLGDCFTDVKETKLTPIVGFSNRQGGIEKVEINFGAKPFRYSGPDIFVLIPAMVFRVSGEMVEQEAKVKLLLKNKNKTPATATASPKLLTSPRKISNENEEEEKKETFLAEQKEEEPVAESLNGCERPQEGVKESENEFELLAPLTEEEYVSTVALLARQEDLSFAHVDELRSLQGYATSLLHFILTVICRDDDGGDAPSADLPEAPSGSSAPKADTTPATDATTSAKATPSHFPPVALVKNISNFGTPKFVTSADSCELQQGLTVSLIQELLTGAQAFIISDTNMSMGHSISNSDSNKSSGSDSNSVSTSGTKSLQAAPSYCHSSSLASIQLSQGIFKMTDYSKSSRGSKAVRPFSSVEAIEIESVLYKHLIILDALLHVSDTLKKELCGVHATSALFTLLQKGSLRLHKIVCNILIRTLPEMSPEDVEEALQGGREGSGSSIPLFPPPFSSYSAAPSLPLPTVPSTPMSFSLSLPMSSRSEGDLPHPTHLRRRQRRMPDTAVHVLLSTVREALVVRSTSGVGTDGPNIRSESPSGIKSPCCLDDMRKADIHYYGHGRSCLESADRHISIVQRLFESPLWKELVACNITDSLRNAGNVLRNRTGSLKARSGTAESETASPKDEDILLSACAACASLSGLGLIRKGGKVIIRRKASAAYLIDVKESDHTARVYPIEPSSAKDPTQPNKDLRSLNSIETMKINEVQSLWEAVNVDLSRLSQPLLPHLVTLVQQLLIWFSSRPTPSSSAHQLPNGSSGAGHKSRGDSFDSLMYRLCAMATAALSVLMDRYPDTIIEAAQDVHTVRDIISISSRSTGLPFFPSLLRVNRMWGFAQARVLETSPLGTIGPGTKTVPSTSTGTGAVQSGKGELKDPAADQDANLKTACVAAAPSPASSAAVSLTDSDTSIGATPFRDSHAVDASAAPSEHDTAAAAPDSTESPPSTTASITVAASLTAGAEFLPFDTVSRTARMAAAEALSCELGVSSAECLLTLEFFMGKEDLARAQLQKEIAAAVAGGEGGVREEVKIVDPDLVSTVDLSDEYPLRNVRTCDAFGDTKKEQIVVPWRSLIPNDVILERLAVSSAVTEGDKSLTDVEFVTGPNGESLLVTTPSPSDASKASSVIPLGTCLAKTDEEGPARFPPRDSIRQYMSDGVPRTYTIVSSYDYNLGIPTCELVETSSLRVLRKYFDRPVNTMTGFVKELDVAVTILRLREIASKLLAEGNLNLHKDTEKVEDWLKILRLAVLSESTVDFTAAETASSGKSLQSLPAMCSALLLRARNSPPFLPPVPAPHLLSSPKSRQDSLTIDSGKDGLSVEKDRVRGLEDAANEGAKSPLDVLATVSDSLEQEMVELLVRDVEESFSCLSQSTIGTNGGDKYEGETFVCASPHPFTTPCTSSGCIDIPPTWRSTLVNFHHLCSTPSKLASLHFFKSKSDYDADIPAYSFNGKATGDTSAFASFVFVDVTTLYYRFGAILGSDRPPVGIAFQDGKVFTDPLDDSISIPEEDSSSNMGLGEDDSLFNLFNEPEPDSAVERTHSATVTDNSHGVSEGAWYYEANIVLCDQGEGDGEVEEQSAPRANSLGVSCTFVDCQTAPNSDKVRHNAECFVCLASTGIVVIRKKLDNEVFEVNALDTGLGTWTAGDVLGCLFVITSNNTRTNGTTGPGTESDALTVTGSPSSRSSSTDAAQVHVWFHRNGNWSECTMISSLPGQSVERCRSIFTITGKTKIIPNFGESSFKWPPVVPSSLDAVEGVERDVPTVQEDSGKSVIVEEAAVITTEVQADSQETAVSEGAELPRLVTAPQGVKSPQGFSAPWLPLLAHPVREEDRMGAWGYHFEVRPLNHLNLRVSREFTLVWNLKHEESESAGVGTAKDLFFWRAKKPSNYVTIGDMVTLTNRPPKGAIVAERKLCQLATSFVKIFSHKVLDLVIWRPVPPKGYVALGDVATRMLSSPPSDSCYCVPIWTTVECDIGKKVFSSKKGAGDCKGFMVSLWSSRSLLGTFFGSPHEVSRIDPGSAKPNVSEGVPDQIYGLKYDTLNVLSGEWVNEEDVCANKSLTWATSLLNYLLDNQSTRCRALTASVFTSVLNYIRSAGASGPLQAIPLLIRLVRLAHLEGIELPIAGLESLCKCIIQRAVTMVKSPVDKVTALSDALVCLVDLVVEVQAVMIAAGPGRPGLRTSSSFDTPLLTDAEAETDNAAKQLPESEIEPAIGGAAETGTGVEAEVEVSTETVADSELAPVTSESTEAETDCSDSVVALVSSDTTKHLEDEVEPSEVMAASAHEWWLRSALTEDQVLNAQIIRDEKLEVLFSKETIVRKLRQIINSLSALPVDPSPETTPLTPVISVNPFTYPRAVLAQIWYNHVSTCFLEESAHPYGTRKMKKKIYYPGADKLTVTFDRRCCIGSGAKLTLKSGSTVLELEGSFGDDSDLQGGKVFTGCELTVEFDEVAGKAISKEEEDGTASTSASAPVPPAVCVESECAIRALESDSSAAPVTEAAADPALGPENTPLTVTGTGTTDSEAKEVNVSKEWGWGLLIQASGALYESRTATITVNPSQLRIHHEDKVVGTPPNPIHKHVPVLDTLTLSSPLAAAAAATALRRHLETDLRGSDDASEPTNAAPTLDTLIPTETALPVHLVTEDVCDPQYPPISTEVSLAAPPLPPLPPPPIVPPLILAHAMPSVPALVLITSPPPVPPLPLSSMEGLASRSEVSGAVGSDEDRGVIERPQRSFGPNVGLTPVSRPRTRRGREPDGTGGSGAAADSAVEAELPSPLSEVFVYPSVGVTSPAPPGPVTAEAATVPSSSGPVPPIAAAGVETTAPSPSPLPVTSPSPAPLPPPVSIPVSSPSSSSSSSTAAESSASSSSPSPSPPTLSAPCPPHVGDTQALGQSVAIPHLKVQVRPTGKENLPTTTPLSDNQALTLLEKYMNDTERVLKTVAAHGCLIAQGELSIPHSKEMEITISRKNPKGATFSLGLNLIKSVKGNNLELNTVFGIIYVATFTHSVKTKETGTPADVDVVQHVQISHNADAESLNRSMACKVPVPTCTYRLTALSAAHTYDVLAKDFNESGLSCGDSDTCVPSAVSGVHSEVLKGIEAQGTEPHATSGDCSESVATTSSNVSLQTYLLPENSAGAGRVEEEGGVCLTCFETIPTAAAQCSACALDERFEVAGEWVLPATPASVPTLTPTVDTSANASSVNAAIEHTVEETSSQPSPVPVEGEAVQGLGASGTAHEEKEGDDGALPSEMSDFSMWDAALEQLLSPAPPLRVDVDAATDAAVAIPSLESVSTTDGNTTLTVDALLPADVDGTPRETDDDKGGEEGKAAVVVEDPDDVITFTAKGDFTYVGRFKTRLEGSLLSAGNLKDSSIGCGMLLPSDMQRRLSKWSEEADCALLEFINLESSDGTSNLFTYPGLTALSKQFLTFRAACMSNMDLLDVQTRILQFEALNKSLEELIPIVNILNTDPLSLGARIRRCNRYIFMSVKQPLLDRIVAATVTACGGDMPAQLALDNMKSMASREKTSGDNPSDINCFVQAFRQLQSKDSAVFRHVFNTDRVFQISFVGESGIDAGGVFREGVSRIIEDLFSEHFNLLLLCPNGKHEVHSNMEKYVPNPQMTDPTSIQMFEFIGRLMCMSQRVKLCLPFEFPSLIWKRLAGEEIAFEDLMGVDAISCRHLAEIKSCDDHGVFDESSFSLKFGGKLRFVFQRCDGVEEELESGSRDRVVRFHNRLEYCKLVERAKAREFDLQVTAIERGMAEVSPMRILKLFSWQQLEVLVAGSPLFDFELWKQKTEASGLTSKTLDLFWKVMASFSSKEQSGFIRFAWGRSRLPPPKDFTTKMKLIFGQGKLPVAHTCFFSIELPEYATEAEMRTGLLTAINFGVGGILMG